MAATALPNPNGVTPTANAAAILDQIVADGHLLANHTTTHRDVTGVPAGQLVQELSETDAYVAARIPANRFLFRAPFGSWNASAYNTLHASAMDKYVGPVYWEAGGISDGYPSAAADWACWQGQLKNTNGTPANGTGYATTAQCGDAYITEINAFNKGIVLLHDPYGWAQGHTVDMVKYMVPKLKAAGYTFVRLDQVPAIATQLPCDATCGTCTGPEPTQCTSCGAGRYLQGGECKPCTVCADGTYQAVACAANADTVCAACDATCATCTGGGANAWSRSFMYLKEHRSSTAARSSGRSATPMSAAISSTRPESTAAIALPSPRRAWRMPSSASPMAFTAVSITVLRASSSSSPSGISMTPRIASRPSADGGLVEWVVTSWLDSSISRAKKGSLMRGCSAMSSIATVTLTWNEPRAKRSWTMRRSGRSSASCPGE